MENLSRLFLILPMILYLFRPNTIKPYISKSKIQGYGLFAGKNYEKHEVIFENVFPYKDKSTILFNPITQEEFDRCILNEGHYMNHCSRNKNVEMLSDDFRTFRIIATKKITKRDELFIDYNLLHKSFPFIAPALPSYVGC